MITRSPNCNLTKSFWGIRAYVASVSLRITNGIKANIVMSCGFGGLQHMGTNKDVND